MLKRLLVAGIIAVLLTRTGGAQSAIVGYIDIPGTEPSSALARVAGWACDPRAASGSGISQVEILINGTLRGTAILGGPRTDVANALGIPSLNTCGWNAVVNLGRLPSTIVNLEVRVTSGVDGSQRTFTRLMLLSGHVRGHVDIPLSAAGGVPTPVTSPIRMAGWGIDASSASGTGLTQLRVRCVLSTTLPCPGQPVTPAVYGGTRLDVAAAFPPPLYANFSQSGFEAEVVLGAGSYILIVTAMDSSGREVTVASRAVIVGP